MSTEWYVRDNQQVSGPYSPRTLKQLAEGGLVQQKTLIRNGATGKWVFASSIKGLFDSQPNPGAAVAPPSPVSPPVPAGQVYAPPSNPAPTAPAPPPHQIPQQIPQPVVTGGGYGTEPNSARNHRMTMWLVGGGISVVVLSIGFLTLVILFLGATYFRRVDDEALRIEQQRLAAEAEEERAVEARNAEEAEREAWLKANFDSTLAKKIRANAPGKDSLLHRKLVDYRMEAIPANWTDESVTVQKDVFSGQLDYGSPLMLANNTLAMFVTTGGLHFELWHLDLTNGNFRKITEFKQGGDRGKYYSITFHNENRSLVAQFIHLTTQEQKSTPKFQGVATFGWLDVATGKMRSQVLKAETNQNREFLLQKLLKPQLPETTIASIQRGPVALRQANLTLEELGLTFYDNKAAIELTPTLKQSWQTQLSSLELSDSTALPKLQQLKTEAMAAPDCSLTKSLRPAVQFAMAAASEDETALKAFVQGNSTHYLRNHGAIELLHLLAKRADKFSDYLTFQEQDPGTAARDLAIMRIHEIAYERSCREATIPVFDEFMTAFQGASQWSDAFRHAYDLELERARFEIEHATDPDEKREQIANGFYVRWRDSLREGRMPIAERMWKILADEDDFNRTRAATEAQNAKDRDIYRRKMLAIQEERNRILERIEGRLGEIAIGIQEVNSTLQQTNAKLDRIGNSIDDGFESLVNTFGN